MISGDHLVQPHTQVGSGSSGLGPAEDKTSQGWIFYIFLVHLCWCLTTLTVNIFSLYPVRISFDASCDSYLLSPHCTSEMNLSKYFL